MAAGADRSARDDRHGNTALHEAAWRGHSRCVKLLCALPKVKPIKEKGQKLLKGVLCGTRGALHSALLSIRNLGGFSALHLAAQNGHNQSCREILLAGGDPDVQNNYGDTPLQVSCRYGHAGATRIILSGNSDVDRVNLNGDTALHISCAMGRRKLTRILREAGGRVDLKNAQSETPRDIAVRKGLKEILVIIDGPIMVDGKRDISSTSSKQKRTHSKEKQSHDDPDGGRSKDHRRSRRKSKEGGRGREEKKVVTDAAKEVIPWSPYGCHHSPDPKAFPQPRLETLPNEPLGKGEQYYLDLGGNIRKGPVGVNSSCHCAPAFKNLEEKMHRNRKSLRKYVDRAAEKLDSKVQALAMKTEDQIGELTKSIITERIRCEGRRLHLEHWLKRGVATRATVAATPPTKNRKNEENMNTLTRCKSLEMLDNDFPPLSNENPGLSRSYDLLDHHQHVVEIHAPPPVPMDSYKRDDSALDNKSSGLGSERMDKQSISQVSEDSRFGVGTQNKNELRVSSKRSSDRCSSSVVGSDLTNRSGRDYHPDTSSSAGRRPQKELMSQQLGKLLTQTQEIIEMEKKARRRGQMINCEEIELPRGSVRRTHRLDSTGDMDSEYIANEMEKITASLLRDRPVVEARNPPRRNANVSYLENSSPEISKDRHTEKGMTGEHQDFTAMMGFYQNAGFSQDVPSSSSNTLKSERIIGNNEETPEDHDGHLSELTNHRELNQLKSRILNGGSPWKSQVLKKSHHNSQSHSPSSSDDATNRLTSPTAEQSGDIQALRKELLAAKMGKVHEIVARIQNNMMQQMHDNDEDDESESSEEEEEDEEDEEEDDKEVVDDDNGRPENRSEIIDLTLKQKSPEAPQSAFDYENFNNGILPASFCYRAEPQVANCRSGLQQQAQSAVSAANHLIPKDAYFHDISERRNEFQVNNGRNRQPLPPPPPPPQGLTEDDLFLRPGSADKTYFPTQCHESAMLSQNMRPRLEYYHVYNNHANQMRVPQSSVDLHKEKLLASKKYQGYTNLMEMDMEKMAINTRSYEQVDRESNNDSGYSTKLGGSSHGPSPSLSGNQVQLDLDSLGPNFNLSTHPLSGQYAHHPSAGLSTTAQYAYHYKQQQQHQPQTNHLPYDDVNTPYIEGFNGTSSLV